MKFASLPVATLMASLPALAQTLVWQQLEPIVIVPGSTTTLKIAVQTAGSPSKVTFESTLQPGVEVPMFDDGTNGDSIAGDGIYTLVVPSAPIVAALKPVDVHRPVLGYIRPYGGSSAPSRYNIIGQVADSAIPSVPVSTDAADVQHTDYVVNILSPQTFPAASAPTLGSGTPTALLKRFYQLYPDSFDVINIALEPSFFQNSFHYTVRNAVKGIGSSSTFDVGASYGSASRLQGFSVFSTDGYDGATVRTLHEFGHQFIDYLNIPPLAQGIPHWPVSTMASGIMGFSGQGAEGLLFPCLIQQSGSGLVLAPNPNEPVFSDMDLYLMGLLPASQVGTQIVLANQDANSVLGQCGGTVYSGAYSTLQLSDVIANPAVGPRVPDVASSPKQFRLATVIVTRDELLSPQAMSFYDFFARRLEQTIPVPVRDGLLTATDSPFAVATRGLGSWVGRITPQAAPSISSGGITPLYSSSTSITPGSWVSIYGSNLAAGTATWQGDFPTTLGNVSVTIDGKPAYLWYVSPGQINLQAPDDTNSGTVNVVVTNPNGSASSTTSLTQFSPSLSLFDSTHVAAVSPQPNGTYSLVGAFGQFGFVTNPVQRGFPLELFGVGFGPTNPSVPAGKAFTGSAPTVSNIAVTIGGVSAKVTYSGITGAGLYQLNVVVPTNIGSGDQLVQATVGGVSTPGGIYVAVQ
jgi:uncharacterized protein (TIGR03437 family)